MRNRLIFGTLALSLSLLVVPPAGAVIAVGGANDQDGQQMKAMSAPAPKQVVPAPNQAGVVRLERVYKIGGDLRRGMHGQQIIRVVGRTGAGREVLAVTASTGGSTATLNGQPVTNATGLVWIMRADPSALSASDRQALNQAVYYLQH